jgi:hypothetical protein
LLTWSELRIFNTVIGIASEQLSLSLKFSPQLRCGKIALNLFKPAANARNEELPTIFFERSFVVVPDYGAPDVTA